MTNNYQSCIFYLELTLSGVIPIGEYGSEGEGREQDHWSVPSTNSKKCHKSLRSNGAALSLAYHSTCTNRLIIKFAKGNSSIGWIWEFY
jgi:hypothetical protein